MLSVDIITFYDRLKQRWESKSGLVLFLITIIVAYFLIFKHFQPEEFQFNVVVFYLAIPSFISGLVYCYWLYSTNRFFLRMTSKITAGVIFIIDNEKDKIIISKIVNKVIHHINNSKDFSNVKFKLLPSNSFITDKEVEKYHNNFNFMYDIILRIFIEAGQYDSIEKIIIEKISVTLNLKNNNKRKIIFYNAVDLSQDMNIQFGSRNWEYALNNSGADNKKYFENLLPIFLYYLGFYCIYVDKYEDALAIMTPIYKTKKSIIPIAKKEGNKVQIQLKPIHLAEGRLNAILVDLFFYSAIKAYFNSDTKKALENFKKLENIIKSHPQQFDQYINMARYSYELGNLPEAVKYTELARQYKPNSVEILLNLAFFAILDDNKDEFCNKYLNIYKKGQNSNINWVEILEFQLKEQNKNPERKEYFDFTIAFIEYVFLKQMKEKRFVEIIDGYKIHSDYFCFYKLGSQIINSKPKTRSSFSKQSNFNINKRKKKRK